MWASLCAITSAIAAGIGFSEKQKSNQMRKEYYARTGGRSVLAGVSCDDGTPLHTAVMEFVVDDWFGEQKLFPKGIRNLITGNIGLWARYARCVIGQIEYDLGFIPDILFGHDMPFFTASRFNAIEFFWKEIPDTRKRFVAEDSPYKNRELRPDQERWIKFYDKRMLLKVIKGESL